MLLTLVIVNGVWIKMKILDPACGSKMFWFDKHEPHTTYTDIRRETLSEIVPLWVHALDLGFRWKKQQERKDKNA